MRFNSSAFYAAAAILAICGGAFPLATVAVVTGALCVYGLTRWSWVRLIWFLLGAIFVFQTGPGLNSGKLVYLAGVLVAVGLALYRLPRLIGQPWAKRFKPALIGSGVLAGWILVPGSVYALVFMGNDVQNYFRDSLTYLLISAGVVMGIDAASEMTPRIAKIISMTVGGIAAYGFASTWIARRGFAGIPSDQINQALFASMAALVVPLSLALTLGMSARIKFWWLAYAASLFLSVFVTGARTGLALAAIIFGLVGTRGRGRVPFHRAIIGGILVIAGVGITLPIFSAEFTSETFGRARLEQTILAITRGVAQDQSGAIRETAYQISGSIFQLHPLMGQGIGRTFPNPQTGAVTSAFSVDTPFVLPAKFGALGTIVVLVAIALVAYACMRRAGLISLRESTVARGAVAAWVALLPFGTVTEDKGFALSVAMLVLLVGSAAKAALAADSPHKASVANPLARVSEPSVGYNPLAARHLG